jgi:hypothetical protein
MITRTKVWEPFTRASRSHYSGQDKVDNDLNCARRVCDNPNPESPGFGYYFTSSRADPVPLESMVPSSPLSGNFFTALRVFIRYRGVSEYPESEKKSKKLPELTLFRGGLAINRCAQTMLATGA